MNACVTRYWYRILDRTKGVITVHTWQHLGVRAWLDESAPLTTSRNGHPYCVGMNRSLFQLSLLSNCQLAGGHPPTLSAVGGWSEHEVLPKVRPTLETVTTAFRMGHSHTNFQELDWQFGRNRGSAVKLVSASEKANAARVFAWRMVGSDGKRPCNRSGSGRKEAVLPFAKGLMQLSPRLGLPPRLPSECSFEEVHQRCSSSLTFVGSLPTGQVCQHAHCYVLWR